MISAIKRFLKIQIKETEEIVNLALLLAVPVLIGLGGLIFGKGKVTLKEFLAHEAALILVVGIGYAIALTTNTSDTEIWNGTVARKWQGTQHCCHSYQCNCHEICSGSGTSRSCSTHCSTCYLHSHDITWEAESTNGERVYSDGCNSPGSGSPRRYDEIVIGEPTAVEHSYTNYIKANPDSIMVRRGVTERLLKRVPAYPRPYDFYRADRFIPVGLWLENLAYYNRELSRVNAREGAPKQVNITVIVAKIADQVYLEAVRQAWLGGKKNDVIVILGVPHFPEISWAGVVSWSRSEDMKIAIRNRIRDMGSYNGGEVLRIVEEEVRTKFQRRDMADFQYLQDTVEPSDTVKWVLFLLGLFLSAWLEWYFVKNDPFGGDRWQFSRRDRRGYQPNY